MTENQYYITGDNFKFCYQKTGSGDEVLLAFHGYGLDKTCFDQVGESELLKKYSIYSFDLFFHGNSTWDKFHKPVSNQVLSKILSDFLIQSNIVHFDLMAYSLGARFAFNLILSNPEKINKLILIAPDGLSQSIWYNLATKTQLGRLIFKSLIIKYNFFPELYSLLTKLSLLDSKTLKFAQNQMKTKELRLKVYQSWICLRKLYPNTNQLFKTINKNEISITLYWGKFDNVIPFKGIEKIKKSVLKLDFIELNCGHTNIIDYLSKHNLKSIK